MNFYTQEQLAYIYKARSEGCTWQEVAEGFNLQFKTNRTHNAVSKAYRYHEAGTAEHIDARLLQSTRSAQKSSAMNLRRTNTALDALNEREELLEEIKSLIKRLPKIKPAKIAKIEVPKGKRSTIELMLSDIHYGKKTQTVGIDIIRRRVRQFTSVSLFKIKKEAETYNINEVIVACLGDIIESATMHGEESLRGSEFGNSKQIAIAIESIFVDFLKPLVESGYPITFIGVPGNHDRFGKNKTFHNPGEERLTYTIYKSLELLCNQTGLNVKFILPVESFAIYEIYGRLFLYEHGDRIQNTRPACEKHIAKRSTQIGKSITGLRMGHWHESTMFGRGRVIINESVVGADSFSIELGYSSQPGQTIVQYVETSNRDNPFYQMVPVQLK